MSRWSIQVPHRHRGESLIDVASNARYLDDGAVTQRLVLDAATSGCRTAGDLLDRLEAASPAERRGMLDAARESAGLESIADVHERERLEVTARNTVARMAGRTTPVRLGYTASGAIVDLGEQEEEAERARVAEESLRHRREAEQAERAAEAAEMRAHEQATRDVPANVRGVVP